MKKVLPEDIKAHLELDKLNVEKGSYIDEDQRHHFSDLIFSVELKQGGTAKVYCLLEHKSAPEKLVALQVARYMVLQWNEMLKQEAIFGTQLPPIIPIVVYQGHEGWNISRNFHSLVDFPSEAFKALVPNFEYLLWDLNEVDDKKLQDTLILRYYVLICKVLKSSELPDYLFQLVEALYKTLDSKTAVEYIEIFFRYIIKASNKVTRKNFEDSISKLPSGGERIMNTLAEQWLKEGELKGKQEGKQEGKLEAYQEMLISAVQNKFGVMKPEFATKIKAISSTETLQGLFNQVFFVEDKKRFRKLVDEIFEDSE